MKRLVVLALLVGCSSGKDTLDCDYLASTDNCWKTTASPAASCLPAEADIGVLADDNSSCTYASGQVITFDPPLTLPLPDQPAWDFTVTTNGAECLHYTEPSDGKGFTLTVMGDTVSESISGGSLSLSCPDDTSFESSHPLDLLKCPGDFGSLPGTEFSSSATSVQFTLLNTGDNTLAVFQCQR